MSGLKRVPPDEALRKEAADELVEAIAHLFFPGDENAPSRERVRELAREREQLDRGGA